MKTIEVSFANRRKEKFTADAISLTEAPGWVVLKTAGDVVEMISANVIKRLKVTAVEVPALPAPALPAGRSAAQPPQPLRLPPRGVITQSHLYTPLVRQRV